MTTGTLPSKRLRHRFFSLGGGRGIATTGRAEETKTIIYGLGILLLIAGVIVGVVGIIISVSTLTVLNWWWLSLVLFVIGIVLKGIGTKTEGK